MKEQTLIEELVIRLADLYTDLGNAKRPGQGMKLVSIITKEIEQHTQSKVLEALERVRTELTEKTYTDGFVTSNAFEVLDKEIKRQK
jgi:hypothetical protein